MLFFLFFCYCWTCAEPILKGVQRRSVFFKNLISKKWKGFSTSRWKIIWHNKNGGLVRDLNFYLLRLRKVKPLKQTLDSGISIPRRDITLLCDQTSHANPSDDFQTFSPDFFLWGSFFELANGQTFAFLRRHT